MVPLTIHHLDIRVNHLHAQLAVQRTGRTMCMRQFGGSFRFSHLNDNAVHVTL
jgi:hypothetical protein